MERENYKEEIFGTPQDPEMILRHMFAYACLDHTKAEGIYTPHGFVVIQRDKMRPLSTTYEMVFNGLIFRRKYQGIYHETEMAVHIAFCFAEEIATEKTS